jgi:hypothetical protein
MGEAGGHQAFGIDDTPSDMSAVLVLPKALSSEAMAIMSNPVKASDGRVDFLTPFCLRAKGGGHRTAETKPRWAGCGHCGLGVLCVMM